MFIIRGTGLCFFRAGSSSVFSLRGPCFPPEEYHVFDFIGPLHWCLPGRGLLSLLAAPAQCQSSPVPKG